MPFSLATSARVLRFGLYGRYRSSTAAAVSASVIFSASSGVSLPCSSIEASTVCFLSSRFLRYLSLSSSALRVSSSSAPVASLRYLAMNGIVLPPSISSTTAATCHSFIPRSCAIFSPILLLTSVIIAVSEVSFNIFPLYVVIFPSKSTIHRHPRQIIIPHCGAALDFGADFAYHSQGDGQSACPK